MSELITEVEEAIRQERMQNFWKRYTGILIAAILAIILGTAMYAGWDSWSEKQRHDQTARLLELQSSSNYPQNIVEMEKLDFSGSVKGILLIDAAGRLATSGEEQKSLELYTRAANDASIPAEFSHLATLMTVRMSLDKEDAQAATLLQALDQIYAANGSPWRYHARVESALIEAHLNKNYDAARAHLAVVLNAENIPVSLEERAKALDHLYSMSIANNNQNITE